MSRLTRRVAGRNRGPVARTYADWQAEAARLATSGAMSVSSLMNSSGSYRTTMSAGSNTMFGTSWSSYFSGSSSIPRSVIRHGLPSQAIFDLQAAEGRDIFFRTEPGANQQIFTSLARNGYTSSGGDIGDVVNTQLLTLLIRWDDTLKKAFQSNPSIGGAETEYTWP